MSFIRKLAKAALACAGIVSLLHAADTARLSGVIRDPQGATITGARIILTSEGTGLKRAGATSENGEYLLVELPIGSYQLEVQAAGFRRYVQGGILLQVNQSARNDVTMALGDLAQEVTVKEAASVVDASVSEVKYTVDSARIQEIPLAGRNILSLASLMPGVITTNITQGSSVGSRIFVNGSRATYNDFQLDGANMNEYQPTGQETKYPSPDAVQEFTILTNAFKAEYGGGGAVINAVSKSGTNALHATVWEFFRNDNLNAANFFRGPTDNKYQYNQFGAAVGGPVVRNKIFFFVSYEGLRGRLGNSPATSTVPTAAQRAGDLSSISTRLIDPLSNQPFAGNIIPASRLDPTAQKVLSNFVPLPNSVSSRYVFAFPTNNNSDQGMFKADWLMSSKGRLAVRGLTTPGPLKTAYSNFPGFVRSQDYDSSNLSANYTHVISPTKINEFRASAQRIIMVQDFFQSIPVTMQDLGFKLNTIPSTTRLPLTSVAGYFSIGTNRQWQRYLYGNKYIFDDAFSWIHGRHTVKIGGEFMKGASANTGGFNTSGSYSFNSELTGNALANFLLGLPASYGQRSPTGNWLSSPSWIAFAQDDFKVTPRLTLNMGFRYEFHAFQKEKSGQIAFYTPWTFASGARSQTWPNAPPGMSFPGDPGLPTRGGFNRYNTWGVLGPRFGFAYDVFGRGKTVVRGAFGISNVPYDVGEIANSTQTPPFIQIINLSFPASYADPFQGRVDPFVSWKPGVKYDLTPLYPASFNPNVVNYRHGYIQEWNFTVEHELMADVKVSASYVGMHGLALWNMQSFNQAIYIPGVDARGNPLSTPQNTNDRRPLAPYYTSGLLFSSDATRKSHALQLVVQKRYSKGLTVMGSYALSNTMSWCDNAENCAAQDPTNQFAEYSRAETDVRHRVAASWVYDLPKFVHGRALGLLANGWEVTGLLTLQGGMPFSVTTGVDNSRNGVGRDRPNVVGDWHLADGRSRGESLAQYFNTKAFASNAIGTFGNAGRNIIRGPGIFNADLGLFKKFQITEKHNVELRGEAFNALNRPNLGVPVATLSSPTVGQILSAGSARVLQLRPEVRVLTSVPSQYCCRWRRRFRLATDVPGS